jgi:hypothetical protein
MEQTTDFKEQVQTLLDLSNAILAAAITGDWPELQDLDRHRTEVYDRILAPGELAEPDRLLLLGALEHIVVVDRTTREFLRLGWDVELEAEQAHETLAPDGDLAAGFGWEAARAVAAQPMRRHAAVS